MVNKRFLFSMIAIMLVLQLVALSAAVGMHELVHKLDYNSAGVDGEIYLPYDSEFKAVCGENSVGCFKPEQTPLNGLVIEEVKSYTEINAYGTSSMIMSTYLLCCLFFIKNNLNKLKEVKNGK